MVLKETIALAHMWTYIFYTDMVLSTDSDEKLGIMVMSTEQRFSTNLHRWKFLHSALFHSFFWGRSHTRDRVGGEAGEESLSGEA